MKRTLAALCIALLPAGCAYFEARDEPALAATPQVLDYYDWLREATPDTLAEERRRLEADQTPETPVIRSVSLALLLSLPGGSAGDEARARELLAGIAPPGNDGVENPAARGYRQFGVLWREVLEERVRQGRDAGESAQALGEQRRQARELQEKNDALQRQIEALKTIEQQMNRREQTRGGSP